VTTSVFQGPRSGSANINNAPNPCIVPAEG
jgi:hypothetical protein